MSLQGTLETIPLPDVLALLAATKKSGELRLTSERGDGRLWLDAGLVVGADVPRAATAVDAVFELLRLSTGSFSFGTGTPPTGPAAPLAVDGLVAEAQQRLRAWQAIEAVVPAMACTLRLTPELGPESVTMSRQQWKELVAVATAGDVNGAMKHLGVGEFDACRTVKALVDAGLVQVGKPPVQPAAAPEQPWPAAKAPPTEPATAAPMRLPAPTPGPVPGPARSTGVAPPRPAPVPGRAPVHTAPTNAAPAAGANGGRSAAARRGPEPAPSREEAVELVQQLATLGTARAKAVPARTGSDPASGGGDRDKDGQVSAAKGAPEGERSADGNGDEPINRGMLLKFLSSVRP